MLSKACSYGLRAVILLATGERPAYTPIREISDGLGISFHFLTKILQLLGEAGIVESQKGPKGGVSLARKPERISVYDVVVAIDGRALFEECIIGLPGCGARQPCPLHDRWAIERSRIEEMARAENIAGLAGGVAHRHLRIGDPK